MKQFEELLLWGKINGLNADYYIAMGINYEYKYEFPEKVFFYAMSTNFVSIIQYITNL